MWERHSEDGAVLWAVKPQPSSIHQRCVGQCRNDSLLLQKEKDLGCGWVFSFSCSWDRNAGSSKLVTWEQRYLQQHVNLGWPSCVWSHSPQPCPPCRTGIWQMSATSSWPARAADPWWVLRYKVSVSLISTRTARSSAWCYKIPAGVIATPTSRGKKEEMSRTWRLEEDRGLK